MHCVWCDQVIIQEMSWSNIFFLQKPKNLCDKCENKLEILSGNRCKRCSRASEADECNDCLWWAKQFNGQDPLEASYSIFTYNSLMHDLVAKWKYRGDYHLANAFQQIFKETFVKHFTNLHKGAVTIPIPLSAERFSDRKFNQAKVLADFLPLKQINIMNRIDSEKQSKKTRKERLSTKNPFSITEKVNKPVILVDDIYTTGTTLRHAASVLKENGCPHIYAYTLIRG
ncbi:ComF family protein [Virgibacillus oceani]|uniref:Amidophosphoribosyltransferase n=1 Tax=Virgibacillus oceani TaxID=1479511 RepID=A0A917H546_9BACI|nr:ComF family protein [Virgibacillus oceani]GGG67395.1 amidophosphoribosyltransferase [Virgibacillus oceani]